MLSGGQQQRVAVARALANHPSVILADEPTAALDIHRGRQVMELFRNVAREHGAGVIVVTHDQRTLEGFDTIYEMEDGAIRHVPGHPSNVPIETANSDAAKGQVSSSGRPLGRVAVSRDGPEGGSSHCKETVLRPHLFRFPHGTQPHADWGIGERTYGSSILPCSRPTIQRQ